MRGFQIWGKRKRTTRGFCFTSYLRRGCIVAVEILLGRMLRRWYVRARPRWRRFVSLGPPRHHNREGSGKPGVKTATRKGGWETTRHAYFYAQKNPLCQLSVDG